MYAYGRNREGKCRKISTDRIGMWNQFFDHADIYGGGESERVFAEAIHMSPSVREKVTFKANAEFALDI